VETRLTDHQGSADPSLGAPRRHVDQLDALRAEVQRLEGTEARLRRRARTLSEHLLAAERRNASLLPAEEEIRRLRDEVARLTAEVARLLAVTRERDATIAEVLGSRSWALTAPLRALGLAWRRRR